MTTTINASTSSGLVVTPDNSGNVLLQYNGQSTPTFSAVPSTTQSISANTWTKLNFATEQWDTNSNYDAPNSRFTPTVAGYYQISAGVNTAASGAGVVLIGFYKNGSEYRRGGQIYTPVAQNLVPCGSFLIYLNGSTDYVEMYIYGTVSNTTTGGANECCFTGCLLRGA